MTKGGFWGPPLKKSRFAVFFLTLKIKFFVTVGSDRKMDWILRRKSLTSDFVLLFFDTSQKDIYQGHKFDKKKTTYNSYTQRRMGAEKIGGPHLIFTYFSAWRNLEYNKINWQSQQKKVSFYTIQIIVYFFFLSFSPLFPSFPPFPLSFSELQSDTNYSLARGLHWTPQTPLFGQRPR